MKSSEISIQGPEVNNITPEPLDGSEVKINPLESVMLNCRDKKTDNPVEMSVTDRIMASDNYCCKKKGGKKGRCRHRPRGVSGRQEDCCLSNEVKNA